MLPCHQIIFIYIHPTCADWLWDRFVDSSGWADGFDGIDVLKSLLLSRNTVVGLFAFTSQTNHNRSSFWSGLSPVRFTNHTNPSDAASKHPRANTPVHSSKFYSSSLYLCQEAIHFLSGLSVCDNGSWNDTEMIWRFLRLIKASIKCTCTSSCCSVYLIPDQLNHWMICVGEGEVWVRASQSPHGRNVNPDLHVVQEN